MEKKRKKEFEGGSKLEITWVKEDSLFFIARNVFWCCNFYRRNGKEKAIVEKREWKEAGKWELGPREGRGR
jgi:hypothetical protein